MSSRNHQRPPPQELPARPKPKIPILNCDVGALSELTFADNPVDCPENCRSPLENREYQMKRGRLLRSAMMFLSGATLLQAAGCTPPSILDILQTAFLAVTAAGSLAILNNI